MSTLKCPHLVDARDVFKELHKHLRRVMPLPPLGGHHAEGIHVLQACEGIGNSVDVLGLIADKDSFWIVSLLEGLKYSVDKTPPPVFNAAFLPRTSSGLYKEESLDHHPHPPD